MMFSYHNIQVMHSPGWWWSYMTDAAIIIVLLWTMELYSLQLYNSFLVSRIAAVNHDEWTAKTAAAAPVVGKQQVALMYTIYCNIIIIPRKRFSFFLTNQLDTVLTTIMRRGEVRVVPLVDHNNITRFETK